MNKSELINKIMNEVKDESLRDELLKQVLNSSDNSTVMSELEKLGLNKTATKEYVKFQMKTGVVAGYIACGIFIIIGIAGVISSLFSSTILTAVVGILFFGIFLAFGIIGIKQVQKARAIIN